MDNEIIDQETAKASLGKIRYELGTADDVYHEATSSLRQAILDTRPTGVVTVPQMAEAIGKNRNYIDTLWSASGKRHADVKQTRVVTDTESYPDQAREILTQLGNLAHVQYRAHAEASLLRAERDRITVMIYTSKILGPGAIAMHLGIDRNHVLRIVRNAGVAPAHRTNIKNQHTQVKGEIPEGVSGIGADVLAEGIHQDQLEFESVLTPSIDPFRV